MNHFDQMQAIVEHARAWGIDDNAVSLRFGKVPVLTLSTVEDFREWARHLIYPTIQINEGVSVGAFGMLMRGQAIWLLCDVPAAELAAFGRHGYIEFGHLDQLRRGTAKAAANELRDV
ncbi:hypothetical protein DMH01_03460 [Amycolatopsis sp. WAC 04182]|uniref:hypothetical protein n=1 Tax=Amycolatopsis sp. WAC 04182 TaxID=2203198 RepID=UPI000F7B8911|nr:hypothetical protein [Amycolatopsis sp. WAC 04182]RSN65447.1 hypothetical protein DMH01_03460 [Amycolatopsis sp. WAC 04182]